MSLWIITTPWRGEGWESVLVEADDMEAAGRAAAAELRRVWQTELDNAPAHHTLDSTAPHPLALGAQEHLANIVTMDGWTAFEVTPPFVFEIGHR
jgi:hypothetical protein